MTYLALARKWRPKNFTEVMGQSHVVKALSNALSSGRVHHAFLFTGTRGVGKTTLARIFAKSLNCEQGMSATPCGKCSICTNVDQGRFIDLIEVDAASRTGIDDMRELLDNIQYAPTQGRFKVYLIDEIHMLSKSSFNALLKTLEEPPEHVKFLFATTDPQKLPVTVLSRCLQFNLKALQPDEISQQISHILTAEDIAFDDSGVQLISRAADGSLRDALSLLEQGIAQGGGAIDAESVRAMLGTVKASHMDELLEAIIQNDTTQALSTVQNMASYAADFDAAINQLLIELHTIALAQIAADALSYKVADVEKYIHYASRITAEDIQLCYQIALIAKRDMALAPDYRSGFEMAIMRIIAFKPVDHASAEHTQTTSVAPTNEATTVTSSNATPSTKQTESNTEERQGTDNNSSVVPLPIETGEQQEAVDDSTAHSPEPTEQMVSETPASVQAQTTDQSQTIAQPQTTAPRVSETMDTLNSVSIEDDNRRAPSMPQVDGHKSVDSHTDENSSDSYNQAPQAPQMSSDAFNATVTTNSAPTIDENSIPIMDNSRVIPERYEPNRGNDQAQTATASPAQVSPSAPTLPSPNDDIDIEDPSIGLPQAPMTEWAGFVEQLELNGLVRELALNMACADLQAEPMRLSLDPNFQYMKNASREEAIIEEVRKLRGTNYQVNIVVESTIHETPSERIKRLSEERDQNRLQQLKDDPAVQSVMHAFDMTIDESSIKPK